MRYFFWVSYKGTAYHGWQKQKNANSIQSVLEEHLSVILRHPSGITGSGRTDTGVHARQQVFHLDLPGNLDAEKLKYKLNSFLPVDICINTVKKVKPDAHARYDAIKRSYEYWIIREKDPFLYDFAYRLSDGELSLEKLNKASKYLLGKQNFECFSRVKTDVKSFVCDISESEWTREGHLIRFRITANRFLRGMVRTITGTLLDIGQGKTSIEGLKQIIISRDRKAAGRAVPAKGLYLTQVIYPDSIFLNNH